MLGCLIVLASVSVLSAQERGQPGWPDVFASLANYDVTYAKPVVEAGEKPRSYRQKAVYTWSGGRFEILEITLARDPAFKERYSPATLRKEKNPPRELEVNKKKAWQWEFPPQPRNPNQVIRRLVVVLDTDKALIIEQIGGGAELEEVAKKFDLARIEKALAQPPKK